MYEQAYAKVMEAVLFYESQAGIHKNGEKGMQGVESDTAAARVVDRVCQQVVKIYQHGGHHYQVGEFPVTTEK